MALEQQKIELLGDDHFGSALGGTLLTDAGAARDAFKAQRTRGREDVSFTPQVTFVSGDNGDNQERNQFLTAQDSTKPNEVQLREDGIKALTDKDYRTAEDRFTKLLELRRELHGELSPEVAESLNLLGTTCESTERYADAQQYYARSANVCAAVYGRDHFYTGMQIQNVAHMDSRLGNLEESKINYQEALRIYELADPMHVQFVARETMLTLNDYSHVLERSGDLKGAAAQQQRINEIADAWKQRSGNQTVATA